ncbi:MAG TPA: low-specificity L-threonine aldolase [Roseiflexaceae bacterium]|nr:low-specificity L-threonine aldolase [Roseiflexaceae bacterium]
MRVIDLRSDTVTLPTPAMREAMARAELGDDVYGEDPTVNRLEALAAERVGKEAAVLVASGTMGNLAALLAHCGRGDEALVGSESHVYHYEAGGASALGGIIYRVVPNLPDGRLDPAALDCVAYVVDDPHHAAPRVICLENTHNRCGGAALAPAYMQEVGELARARGLAVHLDGARVFNAAVALGVDVRAITRHVDSVTFCLSKGLSAPVGSVLCGSAAFVARARRARKILGGSMRQAGVFAAAGIVALEQMVDRLAEDHANARLLAEGLARLPQIAIDPGAVQTDIVYFGLRNTQLTPAELVGALRERGVLMGDSGGGRIRAVTHYGIDAGDIEEVLEAVRATLNVER